jgi:DNA-binding transcriptional MerR regulator
MRISGLSKRTGVSVATLKFYLREGLLPAGQPTAANQAEYGDEHVHRVSLIRVLRDVAGLDLRTIHRVIDAIGDERVGRHELLGVVQGTLPRPPIAPDPDGEVTRARADVDAFLARLGWEVRLEAPARGTLAGALAALRRIGREVPAEAFSPYADAADRMARWEVLAVPASGSRSAQVEGLVVGTLVYGVVFDALRRLAHEHHSRCARAEDKP